MFGYRVHFMSELRRNGWRQVEAIREQELVSAVTSHEH